jgi:hypothetical protein
VPSRAGRRARARAARHRTSGVGIGASAIASTSTSDARLIGVDLQEHVADAHRGALAMGDDDFDLLHADHYRGERVGSALARPVEDPDGVPAFQ